MFLKTIAFVTATIFLATSCMEPPPPQSHPQDSGCKEKCLPPSEEPPGPSDEEVALSVAAEACLWCLGAASEACIDENEDCLTSLSCQAWKSCTETCVVTDQQDACYNSCDFPVADSSEPVKVKSCNCDVCYSQCLNMCPQQ